MEKSNDGPYISKQFEKLEIDSKEMGNNDTFTITDNYLKTNIIPPPYKYRNDSDFISNSRDLESDDDLESFDNFFE